MESYYEKMGNNKLKPQNRLFPQLKENVYNNVGDFYENGEILITGATGFLGKLLIEKLLRTFPGINKIYIIIREKRGMKLEQRMEQMFNDVVFSRLKKEVPNFKSKIVSLQGQMDEPDLAMKQEDKDLLISKVNIVFHMAATVRFNDELKTTINTNLCATRDMVNLTKKCKNIKMFTYVSTAFSNAYREEIDEIIYNPKTHYSKLLEIANMDLNSIDYEVAKARLMIENVNTYTLTKAAAEQLVSEVAKSFPAAIFRPSIIISTWKEPIPGWIDNLYGPTGLVTGVQTGIVRSILCGPDVVANMVPADLTVNALICSAWDGYNKFTNKSLQENLPIYNYVSTVDNPITWSTFTNISYEHSIDFPSPTLVWFPLIYLTQSKLIHTIRGFFLHYLFGYIFDLVAGLFGGKMKLIPIYKKLDKALLELEPFSTKSLNFKNKNIVSLWYELSTEDQSKLPFNIKDLRWSDYLLNYVKGTALYHLKGKTDSKSRDNAKRRFRRMLQLHQIVKGLFYIVVLTFLWFLVKFI